MIATAFDGLIGVPVHTGITGRVRRVPCDVCGANSTVDDESLADVVARTSAHLSRILPKFVDVVSQICSERRGPLMVLHCKP